MCGLAVTRISSELELEREGVANLTGVEVPPISTAQIGSSLTLLIGIVQILMGLLRLDFMSTYFSDQVVAGFTTGASTHVFVSQLRAVFGIVNLPKHNGQAGYLFLNLYEIGANITRANLATILISVFSILFLVFGKEVISPLINKHSKLRMPIPYELILIMVVTAFSHIFSFKERFGVKTVGVLETGMPTPSLPLVFLFPRLIWDAIAISIVTMAVHISLAKMFAKKFQYELDTNQEFYALGFSSSLSSFFPMFPVACSLGRTLVNVEVGSKTLLSNVFSSMFLLSVILYLGRYFDSLPMSIWIVSYAATAFIDVTPGLAISIGFALLTSIMRKQWPKWHFLGNVHGTMDFRDSEKYDDILFFQGICIFRFDSPLLFTNVDRFQKYVAKAFLKWETSPEYYIFRDERRSPILLKQENIGQAFEKDEDKSDAGNSATDSDDSGHQDEMIYETGEALSRHFIVDCSGFTFVDYMGVSALKEVYCEMLNRGVRVYFAAAKAPVREKFELCGFYNSVPKENFYPSIGDAVEIARVRQKEKIGTDAQTCVEHNRLKEMVSSLPMD